MKKLSKSFSAAVTETLVLLQLKNNPSYGYELQKKIEEATNGIVTRTAATLYPLLKKLEKMGWIKSDWEQPIIDRPKRIYTITKAGIKEAEGQKEEWNTLLAIINKL